MDNVTLAVILLGFVLLIALSYFIMRKNKKEPAKKKNLKENLCTCGGTMSLNKKIVNRNLANPAGYQFKQREGGYDFIAV